MRVRHWIVLLPFLTLLAIMPGEASWHCSSQRSIYGVGSGPSISNVQTNASTVGRYERFELTFEISGTTATNLQFPYDPDPPPGAPPGVGITVDGLFSNDGWATTIVQPAFLYQDFDHQTISWAGVQDRDWLYPRGDPVWRIRFAPQDTGSWQYRIRATDASGTVETTPQSFTVTPSSSRGFVRVSQTDPRYFEFSDGTPFIGVGHNEGFDPLRLTSETDQKFQGFATNRANFFRIWMSGSSIVGSAWAPWRSHHLPGEGGYLPATSLTSEEGYGGQPFSLRLSTDNPCMFQGHMGNVAVEPNRTYQLMVRLKAVGLGGSGSYGFVVKTAQWLDTACANAGNGTLLLGPVTETSGPDGWQEVTTTFTTSSDQYFLNNLYLALENVASGVVYIDDVSIREDPGGGYGPEILPKNRFNYHLYFDQLASWQWDYILDRAAEQGIYLKLVVLEKNDWIYNQIDLDGSILPDDSGYDNNLFYAAPDTAVRRLHEYYWRYLAARWGYSTAVHSWELINEGDPYNGNHYDQTNSFAAYIHADDPSQHLVTTSTWHSFPVLEFWGNPSYPDVDYADLHAYISTGRGNYEYSVSHPLAFERNPTYVYGGEGMSVRVPGGLADGFMSTRSIPIKGRGTWSLSYQLKADNLVGDCGMSIYWQIDDGSQPGTRGNVPGGEQYWICSTPTGSYDWTLESGGFSLGDDDYHWLHISFVRGATTGGDSWIDNLEIRSPDGRLVPIFGDGTFNDRKRLDYDTASYTEVYSRRDGALSISGAGKPVVRGEAGIDDYTDPQGELPELANDTQGVWLHNYTWGLINPGGMYELYWWVDNIRNHDLYPIYKPFRDFMEGIPLNNGNYVDAEARTSSASLGAWGQKDTMNGRAHLWIRNKNQTWRNVVDGVPMTPLDGTVTLSGFRSGLVEVEWWDTYAGIIIRRETVSVGPSGFLTLHLSNLETDVACHIVQTGSFEWSHSVYMSVVMK
jgi:hypothetical protein